MHIVCNFSNNMEFVKESCEKLINSIQNLLNDEENTIVQLVSCYYFYNKLYLQQVLFALNNIYFEMGDLVLTDALVLTALQKLRATSGKLFDMSTVCIWSLRQAMSSYHKNKIGNNKIKKQIVIQAVNIVLRALQDPASQTNLEPSILSISQQKYHQITKLLDSMQIICDYSLGDDGQIQFLHQKKVLSKLIMAIQNKDNNIKSGAVKLIWNILGSNYDFVKQYQNSQFVQKSLMREAVENSSILIKHNALKALQNLVIGDQQVIDNFIKNGGVGFIQKTLLNKKQEFYLIQIRVIGNIINCCSQQQQNVLFSPEFFHRLVQITQHTIEMQGQAFLTLPYFLYALDHLLKTNKKCKQGVSFYEIGISCQLPESLLQIQHKFVQNDAQKYYNSVMNIFCQDISSEFENDDDDDEGDQKQAEIIQGYSKVDEKDLSNVNIQHEEKQSQDQSHAKVSSIDI